MRTQLKQWRVRVLRRAEDWIDVAADTAQLAEAKAATRPGVISVFAGSTISGEKPVGLTLNPMIEDDE